MASTTKSKKQAAPQIDIGAEIFASLRELEKIKGIPVEYMVERLKQALTSAYRKDREDHRDVPADNVVVDLSEKGLFLSLLKTAVEEVEDTALEIHIDAARKIDSKAQVGDTITIPVDFNKFGRIAAQTAKQVVIQGIREAERGVIYDSYSSKSQELLLGTVLRLDPSGDVFVRVGQGNEQNDAVLRVSEQIPGEEYTVGQTIRVYILEVHRANRGPMIQVSRTHPNVVRRLFELETPKLLRVRWRSATLPVKPAPAARSLCALPWKMWIPLVLALVPAVAVLVPLWKSCAVKRSTSLFGAKIPASL